MNFRIDSCLLFLFLWMGIFPEAKAQKPTELPDTLYLYVTDRVANPLFGVHIMLQPEGRLLATTDVSGHTRIVVKGLDENARLQFSSIGYKKQIFTLSRLRKMKEIPLETEEIDLDEVVVKGMKTKELMKEAKSNNKRSKRKEFVDYYERYYGNGQYMKVTECFGRAVEFRREYGCFLTTGNIKRVDYYDETINSLDDLEDTPTLQRRLDGGRMPDPDQKIFLEEADRMLGSEAGNIYERSYRMDLEAVFDRVLEREDVSKHFKAEILKYRTYTDVFGKYDMLYDFSFVPAYVQRSVPLDGLAEDTLPIAYNKNFDSGSNKLFTIMRCIYLYAPVFSPASNFRFQPSDKATDDCYAIDFVTEPKKYPRATSMLSKGCLWIDRETRHLKKMQFDFCYYHLYRLAKMSTAWPPFETAVIAEFDYDENKVCYIKSCKSITYWTAEKKEGREKTILPVESPSRVLPAEVLLREIEGFKVYSFNEIPRELQTQEMGKIARAASRNPGGEYERQVLDSLEFLWDCRRAILEMNQFKPIQEQFMQNSGKSYYQVGGEFFNLEESKEAREKILNLFFYKKPQE
mgnify:FL=1